MEGVGVEEGERKEEREGGRSIYSFNYKKTKSFITLNKRRDKLI